MEGDLQITCLEGLSGSDWLLLQPVLDQGEAWKDS